MTSKSYTLTKLFQTFIADTKKGRRLKRDGKRVKSDTIDNYTYYLKLLIDFDMFRGAPVEIRPSAKYSKALLAAEKKYWKKFYTEFTSFLYRQGCFDNYVGTVIKAIRTFFNYLGNEKCLPIGRFHKDFFIVQQEVPIITLLPEQLQFLIYNEEFHAKLRSHLQRTLDIFITGCTVALRYNDLVNIKWHNIELKGTTSYLTTRSQKTDTNTRVMLPGYVLSIIAKYEKYKKRRQTIFAPLSLDCFNNNLRKIIELAGFTQVVGKSRTKLGIAHVQNHPKTNKPYRFCDIVSSHIMRRTAITTMLMHGVPEYVVKQISGHTNDSKVFYRYVNLAQSYMDKEVEKHFERMRN